MHCCKACFARVSPAAQYEIVRDKSEKYLQSISRQQSWLGTEPALQLLVLPAQGSQPLLSYAECPKYLSPSHCRLCLQPCDSGDLEEHLREQHGLCYNDYRQQVQSHTVAEWPQAIPPQILRSRLAAFKKEMSDSNFRMLACAVVLDKNVYVK